MNPYFLAAVALTVIIGGFTVIGFLIYRDLKDSNDTRTDPRRSNRTHR